MLQATAQERHFQIRLLTAEPQDKPIRKRVFLLPDDHPLHTFLSLEGQALLTGPVSLDTCSSTF